MATSGRPDRADAAIDSGEPTLRLERSIAHLGSVMAVVGAVVPWYTVEDQAIPGYRVDGAMSMVLALGIIGLLWYASTPRRKMHVAVGGGLLIAVIGLSHVNRVVDPLEHTSIELGVYLTAIAGVAIFLAGVHGWLEL